MQMFTTIVSILLFTLIRHNNFIHLAHLPQTCVEKVMNQPFFFAVLTLLSS